MDIRFRDQRVGIFFDIQNLYHSAKNLYQGRVNYRELIKTLVARRQLIRAVAYVVKSEGTANEPIEAKAANAPIATNGETQSREHAGRSSEASFFEALSSAGIELRIKDLQIFHGGMKKDFVPLVEYLKWGLGKQVEVAAFGRTVSGRLKEIADVFLNIEDIPKVILKK